MVKRTAFFDSKIQLSPKRADNSFTKNEGCFIFIVQILKTLFIGSSSYISVVLAVYVDI
jgi:hypothetical protein